mgnify:CR=1 FL=1
MKGDIKRVGKELGKAIKRITPEMYEGFCEIWKIALVAGLEDFLEDGYKEMRYAATGTSIYKWYDIETHFLKKYSFLEGEALMGKFYGEIKDNIAN